MVTNITETTFSQTYKDDYADSDNFHRILFNSGRSLQARELTQLQTIIQGEAEQHARFVFQEGAPVHAGGASVNNRFEFGKLDTTTYSLPTTASSLIGEIFTGLTSTIKVRIVAISAASGSDPDTIHIEYVNNNSVAGTTTPVRLTPGEVINGDVSGTNLQIQTTNTTANPAVGRGTQLTCVESTLFVSGHFVFVPKQSIIVSKYSDTPDATIGFTVSEQVVTANDDTSLYDNQGTSPNLTAPGADRYKISLTLANQSDVAAGTTFIPSYVITSGLMAKQKESGDKSLATLGKIMAERTQEESGSYTVKPFIMKTKDNDSDNTRIDIRIGQGIAYVNGFRQETQAGTKIVLDKPRTTETFNNDVVAAEYGNYVIATTIKGLPTIDTLATVNLRSAVTHGGSTIGTARVRAIENAGAGSNGVVQYRLYIFDVVMSGSNNFSAVRSIGISTTNYADLELVNSVAVIHDTANHNLFFPLSRTRPQALSDISLTTQRKFTGTTNGSGVVQFNLSATGETFANSTQWLISKDTDGVHDTVAVSAGGNGTASVTLNGLGNSAAHTLIAYVNKGSATVKTKTLTNATATITPEGDNSVELTKADIYRINAVRDGSSSGAIITNSYILDNGQRDNFYAEGKLTLRSGYNAPSGDVYVDYDYFAHGASGDFFAVNSYTGQVDYEDIPSHRQVNGDVIPLRDVLDFRSRKANTANDFTSTGAVKVELPANTNLVTADINFYLGRAYRVVLRDDGSFEAVSAEPAIYPQYPRDVPINSMELYRLTLNPYTLSENDVNLTYIDNRRYTMRDIADLDTRLSKIEEITTLNMLELETSTLEVLDSSGNNRLKIGLTADNFTDHFQSARNSIEYKASTDVFARELRPPFVDRASELVYDSANSTDALLIGDTVYPNFEEEVYISNTAASDAENINAFNLGVTVGTIKLSPASDSWFDTARAPDRIIDGGFKLDVANASMWNDWGFNWSGISESSLKDGYSATQKKKDGRTTTTVTNKIVSDEVVSTSMGDTILYETSIQYMRNKFVFFKAEGLRPNTKYFPFFDGISVADWVQAGSGKFQYMATLNRASDYLDPGQKYSNSTSFPAALGGKTSSIISSADGEVEGIFFIPNTSAIKFLTGDREFQLIDISENNLVNATSYATASFASAGTLQTYQESIKHTRKYVVQGTVSSYTKPAPQPAVAPPPPNGNSRPNNNNNNPPTGPGITYAGGHLVTNNNVYNAANVIAVSNNKRPIGGGF